MTKMTGKGADADYKNVSSHKASREILVIIV